MSILIKGVNMPTTDVMRVVITPLGAVFEKYEVIAYAENIPPHGDLIDADNLIEDIEEVDNKPLVKWLKRLVNSSAVVVEREGEYATSNK